MSRRTWYRKHRWNQASFDFGTEATQLMPPRGCVLDSARPGEEERKPGPGEAFPIR